MSRTTIEDREEFLNKVLPVIEKQCEETGVEFTSRLLNLAMGILPKTKKEKAFRDETLSRVWATYGATGYPVLCEPPPETSAKTVH